MPILRTLAIITAAAGVLTGLPITVAQACDDDRFPCPIVSEAPQPEGTEQPRTKATRAVRPDEKPRAKAERHTDRPAARSKESTPAAAAQDRPTAAGTQQSPPASASMPSGQTDRTPPTETPGNANPATAAATWPPTLPGTGSAEIRAQSEAGQDTTAATSVATSVTPGVQMVDPNEANEIDLAASPPPVEGGWIGYLVMMVGGALAAASTARFFLV
jgi:hypothetical protein